MNFDPSALDKPIQEKYSENCMQAENDMQGWREKITGMNKQLEEFKAMADKAKNDAKEIKASFENDKQVIQEYKKSYDQHKEEILNFLGTINKECNYNVNKVAEFNEL